MMVDGEGDGFESWPESSQTFSYIRARKRHVLHFDGILERAKLEAENGELAPLIKFQRQKPRNNC